MTRPAGQGSKRKEKGDSTSPQALGLIPEVNIDNTAKFCETTMPIVFPESRLFVQFWNVLTHNLQTRPNMS